MAHWAGQRDVPDQAYATNAKWPEPWQPWQRAAAHRRKRGIPTVHQLEDELRAASIEQDELAHASTYIIFQAILEGDLEPVREALKRRSAVEARAPGSGCTPIMVAAAAGEAAICGELIGARANIHARDEASGATAFIMAAAKGRAQVLELLLKHAEEVEHTKYKLLQEVTHKGETALMAAAKYGHLEAVQLLLDSGASWDSRAPKENHITALHLAASKGHLPVVMELLDRGALLEDPDNVGMRPLMHAAAHGHSVCVSELLQRSPPADLEAHDERGRTAALHAASQGFVEVLQVLEAAGANLRARSLAGSTGLLLACRHGHVEVMEWWLSSADRESDIHEPRFSSGETPLHAAVRSGSLELARRLLDRGAFLEQQDSRGWTPLSTCAAAGSLPMLQLLLQHGASVITTDIKGRVPRRLAEQHRHSAAAHCLLVHAQKGLVKQAEENEDEDRVGDTGQAPADPQEPFLRSWRLQQGYS
mmetsp:Transcript_21341/g.59261  ORF Transcript_21341/g.59261 Transcript_21341/m.59261 type:complete len:478 (+) Transcript_21341:369-1802(+)|eukprot:CAMPEP_0117667034 /NCGR_PEP_ID=MMETSP0804-20121206/10729_1 /TAXON_ID=1074897 /ORGANISM="Tetraselmis astigmatica, Strain CCMP880" /LENGTH=477 /DNA_ID=CAMNT_0005474689 /DNA_START=292 /DNA_END=1725 /DNA_ORIENTATION=-